jgi:hypothetical protein
LVARKSFEQQLLQLWMTTRVPFTRANLQFYTGLDRAKLERRLDELVGSGVLEVDSDDGGELIWTVAGARRPADGPTDVAEAQKLDRLRSEIAPSPSAPSKSGALVKRARTAAALATPSTSGGKSLIASGALSFFFGPLGWLYAAPLKEALPAICLYFLICALFPHFLLAPLLGIANPLSALAGIGYALRHNQRGERTPLLGGGDRPALPPKR